MDGDMMPFQIMRFEVMVGIVKNSVGVGTAISERVYAGSSKATRPFNRFCGNLQSSELIEVTIFAYCYAHEC